jgi:hypothetical protein
MHKEQSLGLIRHILTIFGGYAVGRGYVDDNTAIEITGGIASIIGVVWSILSPDKRIDKGY